MVAFLQAGQQSSLPVLLQPFMPDCQPAILKYCLLANMQSCYRLTMIIAIANSKGGVGKSTLAVHLAAWLQRQGHRVTLADCDTQQSSSQWIKEAAPTVKTMCLKDPDTIINDLPLLKQETDYVVADGPGSLTEMSRALLLVADQAIVPCKASMLEVRALDAATKALRQSQQIRSGHPKATIVLSMVGKHYRLNQEMRDAAALLKLPIAHTAMILRQIYADAPGQGAVVWDLGSRAKEAAEEVDRLFRELLPEAVSASASKIRAQRRQTSTA
jgi:chromosome partitioning protein